MNSQDLIFFCNDKNNYESTKIFTCQSILYNSNNNSRNFIKKIDELDITVNTSCYFNKFTRFLKGTIIFQQKEYPIKNFELYYYLEIGDKIYTKIGLCEISKELINIIKKI
jgi:hypothetical protein